MKNLIFETVIVSPFTKPEIYLCAIIGLIIIGCVAHTMKQVRS